MQRARRVRQRTARAGNPAALGHDDEHQHRHAQHFEFLDEFPPRLIPPLKNTDAAADRRNVVQHQMLQRREFFIRAMLH